VLEERDMRKSEDLRGGVVSCQGEKTGTLLWPKRWGKRVHKVTGHERRWKGKKQCSTKKGAGRKG